MMKKQTEVMSFLERYLSGPAQFGLRSLAWHQWEEKNRWGHLEMFDQVIMPSFPMWEKSVLTLTSFFEMHGLKHLLWRCCAPKFLVKGSLQVARWPHEQQQVRSKRGVAIGWPLHLQGKKRVTVTYIGCWVYNDSEYSPYKHSATNCILYMCILLPLVTSTKVLLHSTWRLVHDAGNSLTCLPGLQSKCHL